MASEEKIQPRLHFTVLLLDNHKAQPYDPSATKRCRKLEALSALNPFKFSLLSVLANSIAASFFSIARNHSTMAEVDSYLLLSSRSQSARKQTYPTVTAAESCPKSDEIVEEEARHKIQRQSFLLCRAMCTLPWYFRHQYCELVASYSGPSALGSIFVSVQLCGN